MLIGLSGFSRSLATKCMGLNNQPCLSRPNLTDLNPNEHNQGLCHYLFMVSLDICNVICNTLVDSSSRICVANKTEDVNLNVFNMITRVNESKQ